jgi:hypothetical protein
MRGVGMVMFLAGLAIATCFAARAVYPTGSGRDGSVTPGDRIGAWGQAAGVPFAVGLALLVGGGLISRSVRRRALLLGGSKPPPVAGEHQGFEPEGAVELAHLGEPGVTTQEHAPTHPHYGPRFVLASMHKKLDELPRSEFEARAAQVRAVLDALLEQDVADFLGHRERLMARLGLTRFAEMIGDFAAMERNVARAWSALTDSAWDEVGPSLDIARAALERARNAVDT